MSQITPVYILLLHMLLVVRNVLKLDIASRHNVSPDGTWLKRECIGLEPF